MEAVRTLNVSDAGTRRSPSSDKGGRGDEGTTAFAAASPSLGTGRGLLQVPSSGGGLADGSKIVPLERYFWARNALYSLNEPINPLKSQKNGAPSERALSAFDSLEVSLQCF